MLGRSNSRQLDKRLQGPEIARTEQKDASPKTVRMDDSWPTVSHSPGDSGALYDFKL